MQVANALFFIEWRPDPVVRTATTAVAGVVVAFVSPAVWVADNVAPAA